MSSYKGRRSLDGQQQGARLLAALPAFRQVARGNPYIWDGPLRPTGISAEYRVRITYIPTKARPRVEVLSPRLVTREEGVRIPHTFLADRLCLHLNSEWDPAMCIHQTIVPWTSLWLYYYELWHATGEWLGGGHDPGSETAAEGPH